MIRWNNIFAKRDGHTVLDGVSLTLRTQELTVLLGRNGSGKSTLLATVCAGLRYDGEISIEGRELRTIPPRERARIAALLPQRLPHTTLSVRELVLLGRTPHTGPLGLSDAHDREIARLAIEKAGLSHLSDRSCATLSGGERQRAALAMALAQEPRFLLLDEPTASLDMEARRQLYHICRTLAAEGRGVLLTMHDVNEAVRIADRIALLDRGRILFFGTVEELLGSEWIESTYRATRHHADDGVFFF